MQTDHEDARRAPGRGTRHILALLLLAFGASAAMAPSGRAEPITSASADTGRATAAQVLGHLGLELRTVLPALDGGVIVHNAMQDSADLPEEVTAVGAMVVIPGVPPARAAEAFVAPQIFHEVHRVRRREEIPADARSAIAGDTAFGDEAAVHLLTRPARHFNLSASEAVLALEAGRESGDPALQATAVMKRILDERIRTFRSGGLAAIEAYVREDGRRVNPSDELSVAIRQLAFLDDEYPGLMARLRERTPRSGDGRVDEAHYWMEVPFQGYEVLALARELRMVAPDRAVAADLHFYASRAYNAMLTLVGVMPYGDGSLVFAISHLFTDAVLGMGSSVKRSVARREAGALLARHLEAVRSRMLMQQAPRTRAQSVQPSTSRAIDQRDARGSVPLPRIQNS